jgi:hypothetical protein
MDELRVYCMSALLAPRYHLTPDDTASICAPSVLLPGPIRLPHLIKARAKNPTKALNLGRIKTYTSSSAFHLFRHPLNQNLHICAILIHISPLTTNPWSSCSSYAEHTFSPLMHALMNLDVCPSSSIFSTRSRIFSHGLVPGFSLGT